MAKTDLLMAGPMMPMIEEQLDQNFIVHRLHKAADREKFLAEVGSKVRAIAATAAVRVDNALMGQIAET